MEDSGAVDRLRVPPHQYLCALCLVAPHVSLSTIEETPSLEGVCVLRCLFEYRGDLVDQSTKPSFELFAPAFFPGEEGVVGIDHYCREESRDYTKCLAFLSSDADPDDLGFGFDEFDQEHAGCIQIRDFQGDTS